MPNLIDAIAERVAQAMLAGGPASMEVGRGNRTTPGGSAKAESAKAEPSVQQGYSKEESGYTDEGEDETCADCVHFDEEGACRIVEGDIDPGGWCRFFTAQQEEPEEEPEEEEEEPELEGAYGEGP